MSKKARGLMFLTGTKAEKKNQRVGEKEISKDGELNVGQTKMSGYLRMVICIGEAVKFVGPAIVIGMLLEVLHGIIREPAIKRAIRVLFDAHNDCKSSKQESRVKMVKLVN